MSDKLNKNDPLYLAEVSAFGLGTHYDDDEDAKEYRQSVAFSLLSIAKDTRALLELKQKELDSDE